MSVLKLVGLTWSIWKVATKRLGPVGGLVVALVAVIGYTYLRPWLTENYPEAAKILE